jgi:hypothetical protein
MIFIRIEGCYSVFKFLKKASKKGKEPYNRTPFPMTFPLATYEFPKIHCLRKGTIWLNSLMLDVPYFISMNKFLQ